MWLKWSNKGIAKIFSNVSCVINTKVVLTFLIETKSIENTYFSFYFRNARQRVLFGIVSVIYHLCSFVSKSRIEFSAVSLHSTAYIHDDSILEWIPYVFLPTSLPLGPPHYIISATCFFSWNSYLWKCTLITLCICNYKLQ